MPKPKQTAASELAARYGYRNADTLGNTLRRWGIKPVGRGPGQGGESMYDETEVAAAFERRPRPARPDLRSTTMESPAFRKIMATARRRHGGTAAEFDYSLSTGQAVDADGEYTGAVVAVDNAIYTVANDGHAGTAEEHAARARALREQITPELDTLIAECKAKSYTGWSNASRGPIRYAD